MLRSSPEIVGQPQPSNPAAVREALQWGYRDALRELGELLESYGISIREAAFRGDDATAKAHVMQARLTVIEAVGAVKELERLKAGMTAAG